MRGQLWVSCLSLLQHPHSSLQRSGICPLLWPVHQEQILADRGLMCVRQGQPLLRWQRREQLQKHCRGPVYWPAVQPCPRWQRCSLESVAALLQLRVRWAD